MQFTINKKNFQKLLSSGSAFAGRSKTMPILDCAKVKISDGIMSVVSTDMENTIRQSMTVDIDGDIQFCVEPKGVIQYLNLIADDNVFVEVKENASILSIKHKKGSNEYPLQRVDEYPLIKKEKNVTKHIFDATTLYNWIGIGQGFLSSDDLRPVMTGIYVYVKDGEFGFCATDSHYLVTDNTKIESEDCSFIINKGSIKPLLSMLANTTDITVYVSERNVMFETDNSTLMMMCIEGRFPSFKNVIPKSFSMESTVDKKEFIGAIGRVSLASSKTSQILKMKLSGFNLDLVAEDIDFSRKGTESLLCEGNSDILIGIKSSNMIQVLNATNSSRVQLNFNSNSTPIVVKEVDNNPNKVLLIMPVSAE